MLHALLNITADSHVTLPVYFTIAFVEITDILAQTSALLTVINNYEFLIKMNKLNF